MGIIKKHYHWIIAAVILLELAVHAGILNNISGLYIIPVTAELGISRGSFSLVYSIRSLVSFFSTLFSGVFFARYGFRKLASIALVMAAGAYALLGCSQNLLMLAIASAIMGLGEGFCSTAAASRMINTWFHTHQGLILGLVTASTGLGGSLFSIVLSRIIEADSWRSSYYFCAILVAAVAGLIFLLSRDHPGNIGLLPFGSGKHHGKKAKKQSRDHWYGYEPKDVMKKPTFYLMGVVVFLSCVCIYAAYAAVVPHLQDCGLTAAEAASMQSVMLLALAAAKFLCGICSDTFGAKAVNLICMLCIFGSLILLATVTGTASALVAVLVFSVGIVMSTITVPLLSTALFGYHPQGAIIGIFMALIPAASVITNPIVNAIYDRIGSYSPIFCAVAVLALVTTALMVLLFILADRDRKQYESTHPALLETEEAL